MPKPNPDWGAYLSTWAAELRAREFRVRNLIGNAHWGAEGGYKESILRKVLRDLLPDRYGVSTGFLHFFEHGVSRQQDIIIWDRAASAALVEDGDFAIVPFQAVGAIIEVKSELTGATLRKALATLHPYQLHFWGNTSIRNKTVRLVPDSRTPPVRMVFAYSMDTSVEGIFGTVSGFYRETFGQDAYTLLSSGNPVLGTSNIVDFVVVLDRLVVEASSIPCVGANRLAEGWPALAAYTSPEAKFAAFEYAVVQLRNKLDTIFGRHDSAAWSMFRRTRLGTCRCDVLQFFAGETDLTNAHFETEDVHLWSADPPLVDPVRECPWDAEGNLIHKT